MYKSKEEVVSLSLVMLSFLGFFAHGNLAMLALVWLCRVWFNASYANLRGSHIFKHHIYRKNLILHLNKYNNVFDSCLIDLFHLIKIFLRYVLCLVCCNRL